MRAAVLYGKEDVRVEEIAPSPLKAGEMRIGIRAALTCGTDLKVYKRGYHARMIVPPAVFGHELAGVIEEVHSETTGWVCGQRVVVANSAPCGECFYCHHRQENLCDDLLFLNGAYAESIVVPARLAMKNTVLLKDATEFVDAALTEPLACVVQGIRDLGLRGDERALVIGSGPIGLMFAALLKHHRCAVTVAGRGKTRLAVAEKLGAATVQIRPDEELLSAFQETGRDFDVVIEAVGQAQVWEAAVQLVRKGGTVNFFGGCPSSTVVRFDTGLIHYSSLRLFASFHHTPAAIREALSFIETRVISAENFVDGSCILDDLPKVFRDMASGNRAIKTVVNTSGNARS